MQAEDLSDDEEEIPLPTARNTPMISPAAMTRKKSGRIKGSIDS
jgi:hypothetical protein